MAETQTNPLDAIEPLVISAPFGNYIRPEGATPTLGTFTARRRPGRAWRVIRTLRWFPSIGAWTNRIGLRNPGIAWLRRRVEDGQEDVSAKLISVHGFEPDDWKILIDVASALGPLGIELNMSCPNIGEVDWPHDLFERAVGAGTPVVVKLPPVRYGEMFDRAMEAGVRAFHCCNTLPVPTGGMSGAPLKPVSLDCIRCLRTRTEGAGADGRVLLIGGGGIRRPEDIDDYARAGADRFAVGTVLFHVRYLFSTKGLRPLLARAAAVSGAA